MLGRLIHFDWINACDWKVQGVGLGVQEGSVSFAKVFVDTVERFGLFAWGGIECVGADELRLVEHGLVTAEEAEDSGLGGSVSKDVWYADVEDLASVSNVGIVTVDAAFAAETTDDGSDNQTSTVWKNETTVGLSFNQ